MNIDRIINALEAYDDHANGKCTCGDLAEAKALKAVMIKTEVYDTWDGDVMCIATDDLCNTLNNDTYPVYGAHRKIKGEPLTVDEYREAVSKLYCFDSFTDAMLITGMDIVEDLWFQNEADGEHKPDGTMLDAQVPVDRNDLILAQGIVNDYITVNHDVMDADTLASYIICADRLAEATGVLSEYTL